jgi:hypothetical protein
MSLTGKILTILNVVGALAFLVAWLLDYGPRKDWPYAAYRADLLMNGLPLDAEQRDAQGLPLEDKSRDARRGSPLAENVGEKTLKDLFPQSPVRTQQEEVARVQQELKSRVSSAGGVPQQMAEYARILQPLAASNTQREDLLAYRQNLADDKGVETLKARYAQALPLAWSYVAAIPQKPFPRAFEEALLALRGPASRPINEKFLQLAQAEKVDLKTADKRAVSELVDKALDSLSGDLQTQFDQAFAPALMGKGLTPDERRQAIAHLLLSLAEVQGDPTRPIDVANDPYRRAVKVVGLRAAVREMDDQAQTVQRVAAELAEETGRDRGLFATAHDALLQRVQGRALQVQRDKAELARMQALAKTQEELRRNQQRVVDELDKELKASRAETAERVKELRAMSQALYEIRLQLRDARDQNLEYERKIRELEATR